MIIVLREERGNGFKYYCGLGLYKRSGTGSRSVAVCRCGRYLRGEQGQAEWVERGEVGRGCAGSAHAAHLDTKPHNTLLIVRDNHFPFDIAPRTTSHSKSSARRFEVA